MTLISLLLLFVLLAVTITAALIVGIMHLLHSNEEPIDRKSNPNP